MPASRGIRFGLILILVTGCGAHHHVRLGTALDHSEILSRAAFSEPMPEIYSRLEVAHTELGEERGKPLEEGEKGYPFSREAFDRVLVSMLRETGGFATVATAGEGEGGAGLVLQLDLDAQGITFKKRTPQMPWGIAGWILGVFAIPAQWVHDEVYGVHFRGRATITDRETGQALYEVDLGDCSAEEALNFHERQSAVLPYLLTNVLPPTAIAPDSGSVLEALEPIALGEAMVSLRDGFEAISAATKVDRYRIELPDAEGVVLEFRSPVAGDPVEGESVRVEFDLVFPEDSSDLESVSINGEEEIKYDPRRPIPIRKRMTVGRDYVPFVDGAITISVTLRSKIRPIEAVIYIQGGG